LKPTVSTAGCFKQSFTENSSHDTMRHMHHILQLEITHSNNNLLAPSVAGFPCSFCSIPRCEGKRSGLFLLLLSGYCCGSANRITPIAPFSRHLCTWKVRINIINTRWLQMSRQFGMIVISLYGTHMEYFVTTKQPPNIQFSIFKKLLVLSSFPYLFSAENYKPSK
jgi:hypothetical protein